MVAELGDVQGRLDDLKRRLREPGTPGAAPSMGADPAIGPEDPPHEKPGPEEVTRHRRWFTHPPTHSIASGRPAVTRGPSAVWPTPREDRLRAEPGACLGANLLEGTRLP